MKSDINLTLNKLIAYSLDNLLLDPLDETYTLNRLATVCGVAAPARDIDADHGDASLDALFAELKSAKPDVDLIAVTNVLFPMPRTVNYYFSDKLARDTNKGFDFLFELYAHGYKSLSASDAFGKDGFLSYCGNVELPVQAATLPVGEDLVYTPLVKGNRIAVLENPDILTEDAVNREAAFVGEFGGAIATRIGESNNYCCCSEIALTSAKAKAQLANGTVKISLLDYPVPVLALNGIAKNAVMREVMRIVKAASDANYSCVLAAAAKDGVTFYVVFAGDITDGEFIKGSDALTACGVFNTVDCSPLLPVLEKGTALSTDLAPFKPLYDKIGGVKLGAKAKAELGGLLTDLFVPMLKAAASATEEQASALATVKQ